MFGFAWVRTHLGVILSDALGVFKSFGLIYEKKGRNDKKFGQDRGSFAAAKGPLAATRASLRRSHCSQHEKCCVLVLFCYSVIPRTCPLD